MANMGLEMQSYIISQWSDECRKDPGRLHALWMKLPACPSCKAPNPVFAFAATPPNPPATAGSSRTREVPTRQRSVPGPDSEVVDLLDTPVKSKKEKPDKPSTPSNDGNRDQSPNSMITNVANRHRQDPNIRPQHSMNAGSKTLSQLREEEAQGPGVVWNLYIARAIINSSTYVTEYTAMMPYDQPGWLAWYPDNVQFPDDNAWYDFLYEKVLCSGGINGYSWDFDLLRREVLNDHWPLEQDELFLIPGPLKDRKEVKGMIQNPVDGRWDLHSQINAAPKTLFQGRQVRSFYLLIRYQNLGDLNTESSSRDKGSIATSKPRTPKKKKDISEKAEFATDSDDTKTDVKTGAKRDASVKQEAGAKRETGVKQEAGKKSRGGKRPASSTSIDDRQPPVTRAGTEADTFAAAEADGIAAASQDSSPTKRTIRGPTRRM
jgi:hypothetical protein